MSGTNTSESHRQEAISSAASAAVIAIAGGAEHERRALREVLLPLLGGASSALCGLTAKCLERALARDLMSDGDYKQAFNLLQHQDPRIGEPVISVLRHYIPTSTAIVRTKLVDAGLLDAILQASVNGTRDSLISFTADCVLPVLGPFFTQNDGGGSITPLLKHGDPRIRASAATAIKNGVNSRHGSLENIANAQIISLLRSSMEDDNVRDLLCYVLPKISPFLTNAREISYVFEDLR
jgi:hypothetical protein